MNRKDQGVALDVDFTNLPLRGTKTLIGAKPYQCKLDKKGDVSEATVDDESLPASNQLACHLSHLPLAKTKNPDGCYIGVTLFSIIRISPTFCDSFSKEKF